MLSGRLINLIENHQEQITASVIREMRRHRDLAHYYKLPDAELRERAQWIVEQLGYWLSGGHDTEIQLRYELLGKKRFEEDIPLHEAVRALAIIKDKTLAFAREQWMAKTAMDLYAEEELDRRVVRFFDTLTVHLVKGYENAWRVEEHALI